MTCGTKYEFFINCAYVQSFPIDSCTLLWCRSHRVGLQCSCAPASEQITQAQTPPQFVILPCNFLACQRVHMPNPEVRSLSSPIKDIVVSDMLCVSVHKSQGGGMPSLHKNSIYESTQLRRSFVSSWGQTLFSHAWLHLSLGVHNWCSF